VIRPDLIIGSQRIVTPRGLCSGAIHIKDGTILGVFDREPIPECPFDDVEGAVVLPGLVDSHVHVNEPGRTEWEGFESATRAAGAGGVTTIVDMPLNSIPPTTTLAAFVSKWRAAEGKCFVDVGFWGGVIPGNASALGPLLKGGVLGFKCFLVPSGVDEFPAVSEPDLRSAMPLLADIGATLLVHAELPGPLQAAAVPRQSRSYADYLNSRPRAAENEAIALLIRLCGEYGVRVHIVHLSSSDALPMIEDARARGLPLTVETCPHYVYFAADDIPDGATEFKCAPPIRELENQQRLWEALGNGLIDAVVSDHSPSPPAMKAVESGDFMTAWGGIASLQLGLSVMWTAARARGYSLGHLARWMSGAPARLAGVDRRKGAIDAGFDADLTVFDPEAELTVDPAELFHRHPLTPYRGRRLQGIVTRTYLRGKKIYERGSAFGPPTGALLLS
jgi:allantoinase